MAQYVSGGASAPASAAATTRATSNAPSPSGRSVAYTESGMEIRVGLRVGHKGHPAVVRFVGATEFDLGVWVGIEYEGNEKGKNDGTVKGKRYFTCERSGNHGVFVRPAALSRPPRSAPTGRRARVTHEDVTTHSAIKVSHTEHTVVHNEIEGLEAKHHSLHCIQGLDTDELPATIFVLDRVIVNKGTGDAFAIVRYIGTTLFGDGVWVGVEFGDPTLGKNDGSVGGVRYFQTVNHDHGFYGLFVSPSRVRKVSDVPGALVPTAAATPAGAMTFPSFGAPELPPGRTWEEKTVAFQLSHKLTSLEPVFAVELLQPFSDELHLSKTHIELVEVDSGSIDPVIISIPWTLVLAITASNHGAIIAVDMIPSERPDVFDGRNVLDISVRSQEEIEGLVNRLHTWWEVGRVMASGTSHKGDLGSGTAATSAEGTGLVARAPVLESQEKRRTTTFSNTAASPDASITVEARTALARSIANNHGLRDIDSGEVIRVRRILDFNCRLTISLHGLRLVNSRKELVARCRLGRVHGWSVGEGLRFSISLDGKDRLGSVVRAVTLVTTQAQSLSSALNGLIELHRIRVASDPTYESDESSDEEVPAGMLGYKPRSKNRSSKRTSVGGGASGLGSAESGGGGSGAGASGDGTQGREGGGAQPGSSYDASTRGSGGTGGPADPAAGVGSGGDTADNNNNNSSSGGGGGTRSGSHKREPSLAGRVPASERGRDVPVGAPVASLSGKNTGKAIGVGSGEGGSANRHWFGGLGRLTHRNKNREAEEARSPDHGADTPSTHVEVGRRVSVHGKPGTVRYVGGVCIGAGSWVGVELDEPTGDSDGTYQGIEYWSSPPGTGILVKASAVRPLTDFVPPPETEESHEAASVIQRAVKNRKERNKLHNYITMQSGSFASVDERAVRGPKPTPALTLDTVVWAVLDPTYSDVKKARALFRWVAANVAYDTPSVVDGTYSSKQHADLVMHTGLAVCAGYADLFKELATVAGLEAETVTGLSKDYGFEAGDALLPGAGGGHAWNAVKIDGTWQLLDVTWGAGTVSHGTFVHGFNDYWFLTPPAEFVYKHMPYDETWQLLDRPLDLDAFHSLPQVFPSYWKNEIELLSHKSLHIAATRNTVEIRFSSPVPGLQASATVTLKDRGESPDAATTFVQKEGNVFTVHVRLRYHDSYVVTIFTALDRTGMPASFAYTLDTSAALSPSTDITFPQITGAFNSHHGILLAPMKGTYRVGEEVSVSMWLVGATSLEIGDTAIREKDRALSADGQKVLFEGKGPCPADGMLWAQLTDDPGKLHSVLKLNVRQ